MRGPSPHNTYRLQRCSMLVVGSILLAVIALAPVPSSAEMIYSKVTKEEAKKLSSTLKTFICLSDRMAPDWCEEYRKSKLSVGSYGNQEGGRSSFIPGSLNDHDMVGVPDLTDMPEDNTPAPAAAEIVEDSPLVREWKIFWALADHTNLTIAKVKMLTAVAEDGRFPEANEILGFAYQTGNGVLSKSRVKAYQRYGRAFLQGLVRVKPSMDKLWPTFSKSEQFSLVHEFKQLQEKQKNSTSVVTN